MGDSWEAVKCAESAVELRPGWTEGLVTLARAQRNLGEVRLAFLNLEKALKLEPAHLEARSDAAELRALLTQLEGQKWDGERVTVLCPKGESSKSELPEDIGNHGPRAPP
eukprot:evm.model.scf_120.6 EVM.evm.TU.scf_120.6   scf_120:76901-77781(+)